MNKQQNGFSIVELVIVIVVVLLVGAVGKFAFDAYMNKDLDKDKQPVAPSEQNVDEKPIMSLGFNLDYYNPQTGMAGDFKFTKDKLYDKYLFADYGKQAVNPGPNGAKDRSPQLSFLLPLGTKVHAIASGEIYDVKQLYSKDYSIMIDVGDKDLYYEIEHVLNPTVKKGDKVKAGQIVAEVSTHNSKNNAGLGLFEVGVLKHGNPPQHLCFFDHVDESVKPELDKKITAFYKSWEEYIGDSSFYDEAKMPTPGCETRDPISDTNDYRVEG